DATVISLVGFAHGTSHFFHLMLPPLFPWFIQEYSVSYTAVGGFLTVFFVTSGTGQALWGFFLGRWGSPRGFCLGVSLLAVFGTSRRSDACVLGTLSGSIRSRARKQRFSSCRFFAVESSRIPSTFGTCILGAWPLRQSRLDARTSGDDSCGNSFWMASSGLI